MAIITARPGRNAVAQMLTWNRQMIRWPWIIESDSELTGPVAATGAPGLPAIGDPYFNPTSGEFLNECRLREFGNVKRMNGETAIYEMELVYETPELKRGGRKPQGGGKENPN